MRIISGARRVVDHTSRRKLDTMRLTEWQHEYASLTVRAALLRKGNQIGGTTIKHWELIHRCRGTHPLKKTHKPPINAICMSESWDQMGQAGGYMQKLWDMLPKDEIDPKVRLEPGRGITGKPPRIVFTSGPGKGSIITFATYRQAAARIAGATIHYLDGDEPIPEGILSEAMPRLLRYGGDLRVGFTPVLNMPDQSWLRKMVADELLVERNPHLIEANCWPRWPRANPTPWLLQSDIDIMAASLPEAVRSMRLFGSWDPVVTDKYVTNFDKAVHVSTQRPPTDAYLGIGIDHGTNAGKQAAVLFATFNRAGLRPYVWYIDEAISDGMTTTQQDATAIHDMLERNGWSWRNVDKWVGDRPTGWSRYLIRKSNEELRKHLAAQAGNTLLSQFPRIDQPTKFTGSVEHGLHMLNTLAGDVDDDGTQHLFVNPACETFIQFCDRFKGDRSDPLKDVGDAGRYILENSIKDLPQMRLVARY